MEIKIKKLWFYFFLSLFCLLIIKIPTFAKSTGIIKIRQKNCSLKSAIYGQVSQIFIKEGQQVNKGELLLKLDTKRIDQKRKHIQERIINNKPSWKKFKAYLILNAELTASIQQLELEKKPFEIRAPINGKITQFVGLKVGDHISPDLEIAQIQEHRKSK